LHIFIDCAAKLIMAAWSKERKEGSPNAEDIYSLAAKLFREEIILYAINIEQTTIAATCSKFAAACSTRAFRMRAPRAAGSAPGGSNSSSKLVVSDPARKLADELRARAAEGGELTLRGAEMGRVDHALHLLIDISNGIEGYDLGLSLGRAAAEDAVPDWLRLGLPSLDHFVAMEGKELLKQAEQLRSLVGRLATEPPHIDNPAS